MRKTIYLKTVTGILLSMLIVSCEKSDDLILSTNTEVQSLITKDKIESSSIDNKIFYKNYHLDILGKWLAENHEKAAQLLFENEKKNEESDQFYFEDLYNKLNSDQKSSFIDESLNAFLNINGQSWKPTIFFIGNLNKTSAKTYLAVESNTPTKEYFRGFEIINSKIHPIKFPLTEKNIGDNNMYVIELGRPSNSNSTFNGKSHNLSLEKMKIKDLKEAWPGRSEISFQGFKLSNYLINNGFPCGEYISGSANCYNYSGKRIVRLKRKWKNDNRTYNFLVKNSNNNGNDLIYFVIFEEDSFPVVTKTERFSLPNGDYTYIKFNSLNQSYDHKILTQQQANNFSASNSVISYNLKLK